MHIPRSTSELNIHKKNVRRTRKSERVASFDLTLAGLEKSALGARRNFQEVLKFQAPNEFPAFFLSLKIELGASSSLFLQREVPSPSTGSYAANFRGARKMSAASDIPVSTKETFTLIEKRYRFMTSISET